MADHATALAQLDLTSPFVAVTVDSGRINATLQAIVAQLGALHGAVSRVDQQQAEHGRAMDALKGGLADSDRRTTALEAAVNSLRDVETRMRTVEANVEARLQVVTGELKSTNTRVDTLNNRITDLERQREADQATFEKHLKAAADVAAKAQAAAASMDAKLTEVRAVADGSAEAAKAADEKASLIASVFNMDWDEAREANAKKGTAAPGREYDFTTHYCRGLPAFATLEAVLRRFTLEETADVKAIVNEKADSTRVDRLEDKIDAANAAARAAGDAAERAAQDVETRVPRSVHKADVERLNNTKADRSELVGVVTRDDMKAARDAIAELRAFVERSLAEAALEQREARVSAGMMLKGGGGGAGGSAADAAEFKDLSERVKELERQTRTLFDVKADKADLQALQAYVENTLANYSARRASDRPGSGRGRAATPPDLLQTTPRRRLLSPISRPNSASIPDGHSPNAPLYYTSLPVRSDSPERQRGDVSGVSTAVFDSNGHRTSALLSHSKAVPAEVHMENMQRAARGDAALPDGYVVHNVQEYERPRSATPALSEGAA